MKNNNLYRKEALDKLITPDKFDKALPITKPKYWFVVFGALIILLSLLIWGLFGYINVVVNVPGAIYTTAYANDYICENQGVTTSVNKDSGTFVKKGEIIYEYKDNETSDVSKSWSSPVTGLITAINIYPGEKFYPGTKAVTIKAFVDETTNKSIVVDEFDKNAQEKKYADYKKVVYCFAPIDSFTKIAVGQNVEVIPTNTDKYTHGHMQGKISHVNAYLASSSDIYSILGLDVNVEVISSLGDVGIFEVVLDEDASTKSGFYWSSPRGNEISVYEGQVVTASVIMSRVHPISLLFPGF